MSGIPYNNIWAALALPYSPVGSLPFVGLDGINIATDVISFYYLPGGVSYIGTQLANQLTVKNGHRVHASDITAITNIAVTCNSIAGRVNIPSGASSVTITCDKVFGDSIIQLQLEEIDATLTRVVPVTIGTGSFQILGNAAASATRVVSFNIINIY